MIQNIEIKKVRSNFQIQLSSDMKNINKNPKLLKAIAKDLTWMKELSNTIRINLSLH